MVCYEPPFVAAGNVSTFHVSDNDQSRVMYRKLVNIN